MRSIRHTERRRKEKPAPEYSALVRALFGDRNKLPEAIRAAETARRRELTRRVER